MAVELSVRDSCSGCAGYLQGLGLANFVERLQKLVTDVEKLAEIDRQEMVKAGIPLGVAQMVQDRALEYQAASSQKMIQDATGTQQLPAGNSSVDADTAQQMEQRRQWEVSGIVVDRMLKLLVMVVQEERLRLAEEFRAKQHREAHLQQKEESREKEQAQRAREQEQRVQQTEHAPEAGMHIRTIKRVVSPVQFAGQTQAHLLASTSMPIGGSIAVLMPPPMMEGFMMKQGLNYLSVKKHAECVSLGRGFMGIKGSWKKRWFRLSEGCLFCHSKDQVGWQFVPRSGYTSVE